MVSVKDSSILFLKELLFLIVYLDQEFVKGLFGSGICEGLSWGHGVSWDCTKVLTEDSSDLKAKLRLEAQFQK